MAAPTGREALRARSAALQDTIDAMSVELAESSSRLRAAQQLVAEIRVEQRSEDELVTVVVDAVGAIIDVRIASWALSRANTTTLGSAITRTAQSAAARAREQANEILHGAAPQNVPMNLSDLVPGTPNFSDVLR